MNKPFLISNQNNITPFLYNQNTHVKDVRLFSITDSIIKFFIDETKVFSELLQEWIKLSAMLSNPPVAESYLSQWRWMTSFLTEDLKHAVEGQADTEWKQQVRRFNNAENNQEDQDTKEKLRILFLTWEFPPHIVGGLSRHVHGLTKTLVEKGHEIHVITRGAEVSPEKEIIDGVIIHRVKPLSENEKDFLLWIGGLNIAIAEKAVALSDEKIFDCIHSHDWLVGAAAISLKKHLGFPLVTTIHATEYGRNNGIYTQMQRFIHEKEKQIVKHSDQVVVCSDFMKEEVQQLFKLADNKLVTIPNGIDCNGPELIDKNLADIEMNPDRKMIFSIGRMVKEKGFDTLIEAAASLKEKGLKAYFIIAGKGPMLEVYRRKVAEMQLTDTVCFIGFIDDDRRNALLEQSEMAIFPSLYEPFGIVALEAMQAGKPTIVSNTGGLKGIIQHLETGLLIEPANSENVVEQISYLMENPYIAKEIGQNGKMAVASRFNWNLAADETQQIYNKILDTNKHHQ